MKPKMVRTTSTLVILAILLATMVIPTATADQNNPIVVTKRDVTINVKVVFVGIDSKSVDLEYLNWNSPERRYQLTAIPGVSTDTTYSVKYDFTFAPPQFLQGLASYLTSIGKEETRVNVLWNESYFTIQNSYFLNYTHYPVNATNTYYPADQVENWLLEHGQDYGGQESTGYTLMLADLSTQLPSITTAQFQTLATSHPAMLTPHFYNKTFTDHDLGVKLNRRYMTAWGGHSRFFFVDLSAGPGSAAEQLPLQLAASINNIQAGGAYWSKWLTQYLADYISGAVYNIFLPDFVYPLNYARTYRVKIFVIDNRTSGQPPIQKTVDPDEIKAQLSSLLPFANVEVDVQFSSLSEDDGLFRTVATATSPSPVGIYPIVDARLVYEWISQSGQGHIEDFTTITRNSRTYDIPVFVFAFDRNYTFGFTYKELVAKEVDFDRTIWGVALYDLVLISHSADDLRRGDLVSPAQPGLGFGFTNTIIHEVGHMLGLMHPFHTSYDPTENFVSSVMAYYPYENAFSQFDKDALLRGYADQFIRNAVQLLKATNFDFVNAPDINAANSQLRDAENAYQRMNYAEATQHAYAAYGSASRAQLLGGGGELTGRALALAIGAFSFLLGIVVGFMMSKRRRSQALGTTIATTANTCSTCNGSLTWIPQYQRWYCYKCQRYE